MFMVGLALNDSTIFFRIRSICKNEKMLSFMKLRINDSND